MDIIVLVLVAHFIGALVGISLALIGLALVSGRTSASSAEPMWTYKKETRTIHEPDEVDVP